MDTYEIAIIGAGPIGIELAVALKRANVNYIHIEAGEVANTIAHYPEQTPFFSSPKRLEIAGYPLDVYPNIKPTKEQYLTYLRGVVGAENLSISLFSKVLTLSRNQTTKHFDLGIKKIFKAPNYSNSYYSGLQNENPDFVLQAKNIVLAIGDMHYPNLLNVPGEKLPHVSHGFDKPHSFFGLKVLIVGGRNSAVEAAVRLARLGAQVSLCHWGELDSKRVKPWLLPDFNGLVKEKQITFFPNTEIKEIRLGEVHLQQGQETKIIPADRVLLLTGYRQSNDLFSQVGLKQIVKESGNNQTEFDPRTMLAAPGVFIIGTAIAGSQISDTKEYIETSHIHIPRVLATLGIECKIPVQDSPLRPVEDREL